MSLGNIIVNDSDNISGNATIAADEISFNPNGSIVSSSTTLEQASDGKAINLGDTSQPEALNIGSDLLSNISTNNLTIGNGSNSDITGSNLNLITNSTNPVNLALNTSGNINLQFDSTDQISSINTVNPAASIELSASPGVTLGIGQIASAGDIQLIADSVSLQNSSTITGNSLTVDKATSSLDFSAPEIQTYVNSSTLNGALSLGGRTPTGNITGDGLNLNNLALNLILPEIST